MNILLLTFKRHEGVELARALSRYGHRAVVRGVTLKKGHPIIRIGRLLKLIWKEHKKHDVIIAENILYDGITGLVLSKIDNIPLVLYVKGYFPTDYLDSPSQKILLGPGFYVTEQVMKRCHCIVYVSQWLKDRYDQYFKRGESFAIKNKPWRVIHHAPRPFFSKKSKVVGRKADNDIVLSYAANLNFRGKAKGALLLLNAFRKILLTNSHSNLMLLVIGNGRYRPFLEKKIKQSELDTRVLFVGKVNQTLLKKYYQFSDIFVYPSYNDACPTVVMEAQACGIPAIVTNSSGAAELVRDQTTGLICKPTTEDLANSLVKLIANVSKRQSMGTNATKHIRNNLCWDITAEHFNQVLEFLDAQRRAT